MSDDEAQKSKKLGPMDLNEFDQLSSLERNDKWKEIQSYIEALESMVASPKTVCPRAESPKDDAGSNRNSSILTMKLARKDREVQELLSNMQEMRQYSAPSGEQLRRMLLDPAVNLMFKEMSKTLDETEKKLKEAQEDTAAWKFTTDSLTGKRLMAKCRQLHQENEQLGQQISSGRIAKIEADLALQKSANDELRKNQSELEECVEECEEESEALESMCHFFKENLKQKEEECGSVSARLATWTCEQCGHVGRLSAAAADNKLSPPVTASQGDVDSAGGVKTEPPPSPTLSNQEEGRTTSHEVPLDALHLKVEGGTAAADMEVAAAVAGSIVQHIQLQASSSTAAAASDYHPATAAASASSSRKRRHNHTTAAADAGLTNDGEGDGDDTSGVKRTRGWDADGDWSSSCSPPEGNPRKDRTVMSNDTTSSSAADNPSSLNHTSSDCRAAETATEIESQQSNGRTLSPSSTVAVPIAQDDTTSKKTLLAAAAAGCNEEREAVTTGSMDTTDADDSNPGAATATLPNGSIDAKVTAGVHP